jgi:microcin C transport system ATP-binding protein
MITHDLPMVRRFADKVLVMQSGQVVEQGAVSDVFLSPQHTYTQTLLNSAPSGNLLATPDTAAPVVMQTDGLSVSYPVARPGLKGWFGKDAFVAVQSATLALQRGQTLGVVGESGSGKSTLAMAVLGLHPSQGSLHFSLLSSPTDAGPTAHAWADARGLSQTRAIRRRVQVVFQDPFSSLSPRMTVEQLVGEGLGIHFPDLSEHERLDRVRQVLVDVGLCEEKQGADDWLARYPHQCSGGQRQRLSIARALLVEPDILVLDEPTSALDVTVQKQVLQLLQTLQVQRGLSYLLITHDMDVIKAMAHRIVVMHQGQVVEQGSASAVLQTPQHPYTRQLLSATF